MIDLTYSVILIVQRVLALFMVIWLSIPFRTCSYPQSTEDEKMNKLC